MIHRLPTDEVRALGLPEGGLDLVAVPVSLDDVLRAPTGMIGEDDVFTETGPVVFQNWGPGPDRYPVSVVLSDLDIKDLRDVAFGQDVVDLALDRVQSRPAVGPRKSPPQVLEFVLGLPDRPTQPVGFQLTTTIAFLFTATMGFQLTV